MEVLPQARNYDLPDDEDDEGYEARAANSVRVIVSARAQDEDETREDLERCNGAARRLCLTCLIDCAP